MKSRLQILEKLGVRNPKLSVINLAAGGESAYVGDRQAQVFVGVDWSVVNADFVVKVRTSAASAFTHEGDGIAAVHVLTGNDGEACQVTIAGADAVTVVDHDGSSVAA